MRCEAGVLFLLCCCCCWSFTVVALAVANRKSPKFVPWSSASPIYLALPRNAKIGEKVARLGRPMEFGENAVFRMKSSTTLPFSIDSYLGDVVVTKPPRKIPTESLPLVIELEVISTSGSADRQQTKLIVDVSNKRPSKPRFARRVFHVKVTENNEPGTFLRNVRVRRPAKNAQTRPTEIFMASPNSLVSVDPRSGRAVALVRFDRELQARHKFTLGLRYVGESTLIDSAELVITVMDVNDNRPRFRTAKGPLFSISENASAGAFVGQIAATDADLGRNGQVTFESVPFRHSGSNFRVKSDGTVYLRSRLDREYKAHHEFVVTAIDQGSPQLSATATVTVEVLDINDSPPKFVRFPKLLITSCENTAPTEMIGRVQADDPDEPPHNNVQYSMWEQKPTLAPNQKAPQPSPHIFLINKNSGDILVSMDTRIPCLRRTHNLTVVAFDPWNSAFKAERSLTIIVTESDEQAEAMRAMIFRTLDSSDSDKAKDSGNTTLILYFLLVISVLAKMLKLMSCVAFT